MVKARSVPAWTEPFLNALRAGKMVKMSAAEAGIYPSSAQQYRKRNKWFDDAWTKAVRKPKSKRTSTLSPARAIRPARWREPFLKALARTSNVSTAAEEADVPVSTTYALKRTNPDFAVRWRAALFEGYEQLELEVLAYLRGTLTDRKIDVANAIRQLAAHRKTVAEMRIAEPDGSEKARVAAIGALILRVNATAPPLPNEPLVLESANHG